MRRRTGCRGASPPRECADYRASSSRRARNRRTPTEEGSMTTDLKTETAFAARRAEGINLDRLCVAARSVLDRMPDLVAEGLTSTGVAIVTRHAKALADLQGVRALPRPTLRAHAI